MSESGIGLKRELERLRRELGKFQLLFALSHHREIASGQRSKRAWKGMDVEALKAGILREEISPGDRVEGRGILSPYAAIYQPRAFYPKYVLGEIKAAMQRGEGEPAVSPHFLPASRLPRLPDGWNIAFLYLDGEGALTRPALPADLREVLVRHYPVLLALLPPGSADVFGRVSFKGQIYRIDHEYLERPLGMREEAYRVYSNRGIVFFLSMEEVELLGKAGLRGSLFLELSLPPEAGEALSGDGFRDLFCSAVEECLGESEREREPSCGYLPLTGYQELRFRSRLTGVVDSPFYAVFRAPTSLGLYFPCELTGQVGEGETLLSALLEAMEEKASGTVSPTRWSIDLCSDSSSPLRRERGVLRGPLFRRLEAEWPEVGPLISWLRGEAGEEGPGC